MIRRTINRLYQWATRGVGGEEVYVGGSLAGVDVTPETAMSFTPVRAAVNCLSTQVAALKFQTYRRLPGGGKVTAPEHPTSALISIEPNPEISAYRFRQALMAHVLQYGNGYAEIIRDGAGRPMALSLLDPRTTKPRRQADGSLYYDLGKGRYLLPENVIHVAGLGFDGLMGYSPIDQCREAIGLGIALERFGAAYFGNGAKGGMIIKHPSKVGEEALKNLKKSINEIHQGPHNAHKLIVLEEGMDWSQTSTPPNEAQFLESRNFLVVEIARVFGLPPHKLQDYSRATFSNIEESNIDFYISSIMTWAMTIEAEFTRKLFYGADRGIYFVEHDMNSLLRGNSTARGDFYTKMFDRGFFTVNDVLGFENRNPIGPEGDLRFVPLNMAPLDQFLTQPETPAIEAAPVEEPKVEQPVEETPSEVLGAVRGVVLDSVSRMVRREVLALRKASKKADFAETLEDWYDAHRAIFIEAVSPSISAWSAVTGTNLDPASFAQAITKQGRAAIEGTEDLETLLKDWEETRAEQIVEQLKNKGDQ